MFEVGDGDFFVGLDGGSEALFCGLVEVVAAEDFFCVGGAEVDELLVEFWVVGAELGGVELGVGVTNDFGQAIFIIENIE